MFVYLAYDLAAKNPAEVIVGVGRTEAEARQGAYDFLTTEAEISDSQWEMYMEELQCLDMAELKSDFMSGWCDDKLHIKIDTIYVND